ncbi:OmpA family protein [Flagellimonas myxillae]|uniref:OmpA family protein n=1 Tax=Flagellimonas myxillae TaxID=2942214 RepID=UPI00201EE823|nr:OmpA family protein [Muricauda myxillae]MCL6268235.1 OmpA family protein [Muricauda myxillae]
MVQVKKIFPSILAFFLGIMVCYAQGKNSSGDDYFFQYEYQKAVTAYEADLAKGTLTLAQYLNLADSYYKTNNFEKASEAYMELYKKDTLLGNHHFNKMLQSFAKTSNSERTDAFLATKSSNFEKEFLENLEFNNQLLSSNSADAEMDFQIFNLNGNSPQSDFSPAFYGSRLLFSSGRSLDKKRRYVPTGEGYLNIYEGNVQPTGQVSSPTPFTGIPTSDYHKATPFYSDRLQSIFYVLSNTQNGELSFDENGKNALAIGMQIKNGPFQLLLRDLSTSFYYPFYDEKSEKLYFSANFEEGYGGTDIYYVHTNRGQIMSAPINLGPRINSPGNEIAPYVFENSFYFSSDVFYGLGGMDIYKSNIEGSSFSIPINLGSGINSSKDDFGFIMRNDGEGLLGYFSSNRPGGKGNDDLYGFKVDQKPGLRTLTFKGKVTKKNDPSEFVEKAVIRLLDAEGNLLAETYSNDDGTYRLEIPWEKELVLESGKDRFSVFRQQYGEEELEAMEGSNHDIPISAYDDLVEEKEEQTVVKLKDFHFDRGQTQLKEEITAELDKVVDFVKDFPFVQLRIETYTDSRGGNSTNFRLTQGRSDAIKRYLTQKGVPNSAILYSIGYGEDKILNNCTNGVFCLEVLHKQNQRSLIVVLNDNVLFN